MAKKKPHPDDVSIGPDEWIRYVDISGRQSSHERIDAFILPMESFWAALETDCVAECCGIGAFDFWPQNIWEAVRKCNDPDLKTKLRALRRHLDNLSVDCVVSTVLNQWFDRTVFIKLLDHIIATVERM
jgi:hypothetical protein